MCPADPPARWSSSDMRIIAGAFKGTRLYTAPGNWLRPTSDRVREFIFSYLGESVREARVLDLFAGTGSFGLEALSRGARSVTFVDRSFKAIEIIRRNLQKVRAEATVLRMPASQFLNAGREAEEAYDLIFCDPPYRFEAFETLAAQIVRQGRLARHGLLIYECSFRAKDPELSDFVLMKQKTLGDTKVNFYRLKQND